MHDPDGLDLKQLEDDIAALDDRLKVYDGRKFLLPWEKKTRDVLLQLRSERHWKFISAKEIVQSNIHQSEIYARAKQEPPLDQADSLDRINQLVRNRALKLKKAKRLKV